MMSKISLLEALLQENTNINVICITETWLKKDRSNLIQITNYSLGSSFSRQNQVGGGTCILINDHMKYIERTDITNLSIESIIETCAIEISECNLLIIVIYWPEKGRAAETFYTRLKDILSLVAVKDRSKSIIIGGRPKYRFFKKY